jgi:hypothetical protein
MSLSKTTIYHYAERHYAECRGAVYLSIRIQQSIKLVSKLQRVMERNERSKLFKEFEKKSECQAIKTMPECQMI